jgi:hypothetical protein
VLSKPIVQFFHSRLQATEKKAKEPLQNPIQNQILIETTANITLINSTRVRRVDPHKNVATYPSFGENRDDLFPSTQRPVMKSSTKQRRVIIHMESLGQ